MCSASGSWSNPLHLVDQARIDLGPDNPSTARGMGRREGKPSKLRVKTNLTAESPPADRLRQSSPKIEIRCLGGSEKVLPSNVIGASNLHCSEARLLPLF